MSEGRGARHLPHDPYSKNSWDYSVYCTIELYIVFLAMHLALAEALNSLST